MDRKRKNWVGFAIGIGVGVILYKEALALSVLKNKSSKNQSPK